MYMNDISGECFPPACVVRRQGTDPVHGPVTCLCLVLSEGRVPPGPVHSPVTSLIPGNVQGERYPLDKTKGTPPYETREGRGTHLPRDRTGGTRTGHAAGGYAGGLSCFYLSFCFCIYHEPSSDVFIFRILLRRRE